MNDNKKIFRSHFLFRLYKRGHIPLSLELNLQSKCCLWAFLQICHININTFAVQRNHLIRFRNVLQHMATVTIFICFDTMFALIYRAIMFIWPNLLPPLPAVSPFLMAALAWNVLCVYSSSPEENILIFEWPDFPQMPPWGQTVVAKQQGS